MQVFHQALQELLGLYHDVTVASAWLLSYAETSAAPPRTMLAAGALIQSLASREKKLRRVRDGSKSLIALFKYRLAD